MEIRTIKPIFWSNRAISDLQKIYTFNKKIFDKNIADSIIDGIYHKISILESQNLVLEKIGSIDEQFLHFKREYRKLIEKNCKITYRIGKSNIYIVRIFDSRQNPRKQFR